MERIFIVSFSDGLGHPNWLVKLIFAGYQVPAGYCQSPEGSELCNRSLRLSQMQMLSTGLSQHTTPSSAVQVRLSRWLPSPSLLLWSSRWLSLLSLRPGQTAASNSRFAPKRHRASGSQSLLCLSFHATVSWSGVPCDRPLCPFSLCCSQWDMSPGSY